MSVRNDLKLNTENCDDIWADTTLNDKRIVVGAVYRHPRQNFLKFQETFSKSLSMLNNRKITYYICGDYNINCIRSSTKNATRYYTDSIHSCSSVNIIDQTTRITERSETLIDHIYTNNTENNILPGRVTQDISDHLPVFMQVFGKKKSKSVETIKIRDMKNFRKKRFIAELQEKLSYLMYSPLSNAKYLFQ